MVLAPIQPTYFPSWVWLKTFVQASSWKFLLNAACSLSVKISCLFCACRLSICPRLPITAIVIGVVLSLLKWGVVRAWSTPKVTTMMKWRWVSNPRLIGSASVIIHVRRKLHTVILAKYTSVLEKTWCFVGEFLVNMAKSGISKNTKFLTFLFRGCNANAGTCRRSRQAKCQYPSSRSATCSWPRWLRS